MRSTLKPVMLHFDHQLDWIKKHLWQWWDMCKDVSVRTILEGLTEEGRPALGGNGHVCCVLDWIKSQLSPVFKALCFYWEENQQTPTPRFPHLHELCLLNLESNKQSLHELHPVGNLVSTRRKVTNAESLAFAAESLNTATPSFVDKALFTQGTLLSWGRMGLKPRSAEQRILPPELYCVSWHFWCWLWIGQGGDSWPLCHRRQRVRSQKINLSYIQAKQPGCGWL